MRNDRVGTGKKKKRSECNWLEQRLGLYLDGELRGRSMERANRHLDVCLACRERASFLERCLEAARGLREVAPRPDFEEAVWERIRISHEISQQRPWWRGLIGDRRMAWGGAGVLTAAAAAVVLAFFLWSPGHVPGPGGDHASLAERVESEEGTGALDVGLPPAVTSSAPAAGARLSEEDRPGLRGDEIELAASGSGAAIPDTSSGSAPRESLGTPSGTSLASGPGEYRRLEPTAYGEEYSLGSVQRVPDPWAPERGSYVVRQVVVATPADGRISF